MKSALSAALVAGGMLLAAASPMEVIAAPSDTLTLAVTVDNNTFDRAGLEIGNRVQYWMPVIETLIVLDPESNPQPGLATEWSYNKDNTVLNLKLREGISFTDGKPFDAEAVKANLEYLAKGTGQNAYMAAGIKEVEIFGPHEVNLILSAPEPGLVSYLGVPGGAMVSPATLGTEESATYPVGTGPYILNKDATTAGREYVYTFNPDYWNADAVHYEQLVLKPMNDFSARLNAIKSGQINGALIEPSGLADAKASGLTIHKMQVDWVGLMINDRAGETVPALGDVRVRQAINYAFDEPSLLKYMALGEGTLTDQIFNSGSQAFDPDMEGTYNYDLKKAKALLAEAGYADGFEVTMPETAGMFESYHPIVEQTLAELGIAVKYQKVPANATVTELTSGKYPMFIMSLGSQSAWQDFRKVAFTDSPWNTSHVVDDAMDRLIAKARSTAGDEQASAMRAVGKYIVDNAWFAPWYKVNMIYVTDPGTEVDLQSQNIMPWPLSYRPAGE